MILLWATSLHLIVLRVFYMEQELDILRRRYLIKDGVWSIDDHWHAASHTYTPAVIDLRVGKPLSSVDQSW